MEVVLSDLVRTLLSKRGVVSEGDIESFLRPDYISHTHDHALFSGMESAVSRIFTAITGGERIAVYADFDCDGIPGAGVLSDTFAKIGYGNVEIYIPHRDKEGYGLHQKAIQELADRAVKVIITVDVGTNARDAIRFAKEKGVDVIVTDHHEITGDLPECVAILNPKIAPYPFPHLCGAAVAYKLSQSILAEGRRRKLDSFLAIPEGWEKWLLDLVAIATIADMVPLTGENRTLAHWGLQVLRKSPRPGIRAICTKLRIRQAELSEGDIGFSLGPRINAASRMGEPQLAFKLLTTRDVREADDVAAQLESLNSSRKGVVGGIVREARKRVRDRYRDEERVVVLGNPEWKPSLLGLAANSIVGDRGGIACLWGRDGEGRIKGSCRSDGSLSVVELFSAAPQLFEEFGGHAASGGFTLVASEVHTFPETLAAAAEKLAEKEVVRAAEYDALITLREVAPALLKDISALAPFGVGNPKPIFRIVNTRVRELRKFGKENNHLEVSLLCIESGMAMRAFDFFRKAEDFTHVPEPDSAATILATIERDTFRGGLALRLVDIVRG